MKEILSLMFLKIIELHQGILPGESNFEITQHIKHSLFLAVDELIHLARLLQGISKVYML